MLRQLVEWKVLQERLVVLPVPEELKVLQVQHRVLFKLGVLKQLEEQLEVRLLQVVPKVLKRLQKELQMLEAQKVQLQRLVEQQALAELKQLRELQ